MLRTIFVFTILGGGLIAGLFDSFAALLLYVWFAMFRPEAFVWWDISGLNLSFLIGILLVLKSFLSGVFPNLTHPLSIGAGLFLLCGLFAQTGAFDAAAGWIALDYLARLILVCLLVVSLVNTEQRLLVTVMVLAGSFGFHSAKAGLSSILGGGVQFEAGLSGAFIDNNGYALGAAMVAPLLVAVGQNAKRRWMKSGFYLAGILSVVTVISTFSRGGALALIGSAVVFLMLQRRKFRFLLGVMIIVGVAALVVPMPKGYAERIQSIESTEQTEDRSALGRWHFWQVAVVMALDRPAGVGLKNYQVAYDRYDFLEGAFGHRRAVHNSHLEVLSEAGFLGAFVYIGLFAYGFVTAFRVRARALADHVSEETSKLLFTMANGLMASMAAFLVGGTFIALALNDVTWLTFALIASLDRISAHVCAIDPSREPVAAGGGFDLAMGWSR